MRLAIGMGLGALALLGLGTAARAQDTIKIVDVAELSGGGATVGTNFKNGVDLAIKEINAKGGILGHKIEITHSTRRPTPAWRAALVQKAIDSEPYCIFGPGFSGSVKAVMPLFQQARRSPTSWAARPPSSPSSATNTSSAPPSASNRRCPRSPITSMTR